MRKITFSFGVELDRDNRPVFAAMDGHPQSGLALQQSMAGAKAHVLRAASRCFGGATWVDHQGAWISPAGVLVMERGAHVVVVTENVNVDSSLNVQTLIAEIMLQFRQACVMVDEVECRASFI